MKPKPYESLWRYMDIHKFIYFLSSGSLTFTQLSLSPDLYEGYDIGGLTIANLFQKSLTNKNNFKNAENKQLIEKQLKLATNVTIHRQEQTRLNTYISCWFLGARESIAMWDIYSNSDSIVIRTNKEDFIEEVKRSTNSSFPNFKFEAEKMSYDYIMPISSIHLNKMDYPVGLIKDIAYEHEKEFRFILTTKEKHNNKVLNVALNDINNATYFDIICHPKMEDWKINNIKTLVKSFGFNCQVFKSEIRIK